jgi:transposase InsO family protein
MRLSGRVCLRTCSEAEDAREGQPGASAANEILRKASAYFARGMVSSAASRPHHGAGQNRPVPADHANRFFHAPAPNRLWLSDFTYVATGLV